MSIYTKTGDDGKTAIFGGTRVWKYDPQVEAYGKVDEASSFIGLALESISDEEMKSFLTEVQEDMYLIMAVLSGASPLLDKLEEDIKSMEISIDNLDKKLPKLTRFILPQGTEQAVRLHVSRAVVRTAERRVVDYLSSRKETTQKNNTVIRFLNRLSDLLFMYARCFTPEEKQT